MSKATTKRATRKRTTSAKKPNPATRPATESAREGAADYAIETLADISRRLVAQRDKLIEVAAAAGFDPTTGDGLRVAELLVTTERALVEVLQAAGLTPAVRESCDRLGEIERSVREVASAVETAAYMIG